MRKNFETLSTTKYCRPRTRFVGSVSPKKQIAFWSSQNAICFFGDTLPTNLVRGRQYFVVESVSKFFRIAERPGGAPLRFASSAGPNALLIADLSQAYWQLSFPTG